MAAIRLSIPSRTRTVSVTGKGCALSCAHCGGRYLAHMETPAEVLDRGPRMYSSALVSGGVNSGGWVPHEEHLDFLKTLRSWNWRLNFHVGLIPDHEARNLSGLADVVSFDFAVDDGTIEEVYGHGLKGERYVSCYRMLSSQYDVVPHITVGLRGGLVCGEKEALEELVHFMPPRIVFLVFVPTRGTAYEGKTPPPLSEIRRLFSLARDFFPHAHLSLGCMRPRGAYGEETEKAAFDAGFSTIVMPSRSLRERIEREGIEYHMTEECCVL